MKTNAPLSLIVVDRDAAYRKLASRVVTMESIKCYAFRFCRINSFRPINLRQSVLANQRFDRTLHESVYDVVVRLALAAEKTKFLAGRFRELNNGDIAFTDFHNSSSLERQACN